MTALPSLTGLRGFAALWVVLYHWFALSGPRLLEIPIPFTARKLDITSLFTAGWLGVHLFFVLSAFLLSYPYIAAHVEGRATPDLKVYFSRRLARILPAYYVQVVILTLLGVVGWWELRSGSAVGPIVLHFFMLHGVTPATSGAINDVYWTLPVEVTYYVVLPILVFGLSALNAFRLRHAIVVLVVTIAVVQMVRAVAFTHVASAELAVRAWRLGQLDTMLDVFVAGTIASWAYYTLRTHRWASGALPRYLMWGGLIVLLGLGATIHQTVMRYWDGSALLMWTSAIGAMGASALVLGLSFRDASPSALFVFGLRSPVMQWLGTRSFSLYLWHDPALKWVHGGLTKAGYTGDKLWPLFLLGIPLGLLLAEASYRLVERPFASRAAQKSTTGT